MCAVRHAQIIQNKKFSISQQYLQKGLSDEVDFLHADKHQSFLQVNSKTLVSKVSYKVILSSLMGIKYSQSTEINKFVISLQYLKKEVKNGVHFLHADKYRSFYKLALLFLIEATRHTQNT